MPWVNREVTRLAFAGVHRGRVTDDQRCGLQQAEGAERQREARNLEERDQEPVQGPDQGADHDHQDDGADAHRPERLGEQDRPEERDGGVGQVDGSDVQDHAPDPDRPAGWPSPGWPECASPPPPRKAGRRIATSANRTTKTAKGPAVVHNSIAVGRRRGRPPAPVDRRRAATARVGALDLSVTDLSVMLVTPSFRAGRGMSGCRPRGRSER